MKAVAFVITVPRVKRRAIELYSRDTPFRSRQERDRTLYNRKVKHPKRNEH